MRKYLAMLLVASNLFVAGCTSVVTVTDEAKKKTSAVSPNLNCPCKAMPTCTKNVDGKLCGCGSPVCTCVKTAKVKGGSCCH